MVSNREAATNGRPYRPALYEMAQMFSGWGPRTASIAGPDSLDFPPSGDFVLTPWHVSTDSANRIGLSYWAGSRHQRIFGFIASIEERAPGKAENTDTSYRFDVVTRIRYTIDGQFPAPEQFSWLYVTDKSDSISVGFILTVKGLAYSSNALLTGQTGFSLGTFVSGIATANYNGKGRAQLDAWSIVTDFEEWRLAPQDTFPDKASYDGADWVAGWACTLGGSASGVDEPG